MKTRVSALSPRTKKRNFGRFGRTLELALSSTFLLASAASAIAQPAQLLSVSFDRGYIGEVANNTQDVTATKRTETCGITKVAFDQLLGEGTAALLSLAAAQVDQGRPSDTG